MRSMRLWIFLRVAALVIFLVIVISAVYAIFAVSRHRSVALKSFLSCAVSCSENLEGLILRDDRVAVERLLARLTAREGVVYSFVERNGQPYIHTFEQDVPARLLSGKRPACDELPVWEFRDHEKRLLYDVAAPLNEAAAVMHLGVCLQELDRETAPLIIGIFGIDLVAILAGLLLAALFAGWTTIEVDGITLALRKSKENLEKRVLGRTDELHAEHAKAVASLKEKDLLLREIHHRVKNNMQVITSLLRLEAAHLDERPPREVFDECHARIESMAMIHDTLYRSNDVSHVNLDDYLAVLSRHLMSVYCHNREIVIERDVREVSLTIETAIPVGLITTELITNSLKHAFPEERSGVVRVRMSRVATNEIELLVSDNGVGISEDVDVRTIDTLGLGLVRGMAETQLGGTLEVARDNGTQVTIKFREAGLTGEIQDGLFEHTHS